MTQPEQQHIDTKWNASNKFKPPPLHTYQFSRSPTCNLHPKVPQTFQPPLNIRKHRTLIHSPISPSRKRATADKDYTQRAVQIRITTYMPIMTLRGALRPLVVSYEHIICPEHVSRPRLGPPPRGPFATNWCPSRRKFG